MFCTGKSVSQAWDNMTVPWIPRKIQVHNMLCTNIVLNLKPKNHFCAQLVFFGEFNEQSLVILWVNWGKNEGFWKRFTCTERRRDLLMEDYYFECQCSRCLDEISDHWKTSLLCSKCLKGRVKIISEYVASFYSRVYLVPK